jgi:hypothetical protein
MFNPLKKTNIYNIFCEEKGTYSTLQKFAGTNIKFFE